MPNPYNINDFSPSLRDYLLNKNIVADTISNNGLLADLIGIGSPVQTETLPIAVSPSPDIVDDGLFYKDQNVLNNQFIGGPTDYTLVDIQNLNSTISYQTGPYTNNNDLLNTPFIDNNGNSVTSTDIRQQTTVKNIYVDTEKQLTINLNTTPVPTYQNLTSYLDENNNLAIGSPGTQAADIIGSVLNGQGVGFDFNNGSIGVVANEDIRATLLGRVLGATGAINDTPLGIIGGQQLLSHVGYNSAFGLQQETLGALNLNPLTLIQGDPKITLNYQITVPSDSSDSLGKVLNFTANILGVQSPISLLQTSIFTFGDKLDYTHMGNIERANLMLQNSGQGQVKQLIAHMNTNLIIPKLPFGKNLRQGYSPAYKPKKDKGENTSGGTNANLYARQANDGSIIDFLNGAENSPIASGNYNRSGQISDDGWDNDYFRKYNWTTNKNGNVLYFDSWGWEDSRYNKDSNQGNGINQNSPNTLFSSGADGKNRKKTLLSKTEELFNSGKMSTLVTGHGVKEEGPTQINSAVSSVGKYTSKGSGVMSQNAVKNIKDNGPENVFCRTWTTYDRYAQVLDLQKNKGVNGSYGEINGKSIYRNNTESSVMDSKSNGFVKIAPYKENDVKKYMFSIENLAWAGELTNLLPCEVGPGDPNNSELKGRIMWFPPYDMSFSETTSANWEKHNFIGRGEPMYTYNNTERTGSLSWKIIIDHPNYLNLIKDNKNFNSNDYLASFFAGCMPLENVPLTPNETNASKIENAQTLDVKTITPGTPPTQFNIYFPNDVYTLDGEYESYEDGKCKEPNQVDNAVCYINRKTNLDGNGEGLVDYREMCYQFKVNGVDTWSSVECSKNVPPGPVGSSSGRLEPDRTDFGLNGTGTTTDYKNVMLGDKKYLGFKDPNYKTDLNNYLREKCPNCKIQVVGFASTVGTFGDDRNDTLAKLRAEWVKTYIKDNILDEEFKDRISVVADGQGATDETASGNKVKCPTPDPIARKDNYLLSKNDEFGCKAERYVTVKFVDDPNNSPLADEKQNEIQNNQQRSLNVPVSRFLTECDYFERLEEDDKVVYDAISEKIKYFQPAFHSTTPEGFNARLTFLQQCMRQGKTKGIDNSNPSNLAFGRPPVCILRIGDFYHTKIVIDNISLDYEPLVWDLNPEGVGVQPMICNVTMSFAFIGGSSLNGPISKLQNALSFNYYANTEMYDSRSDYNQKQGAGGETKDGNQNANPASVSNTNPASNELAGGNPNKILDTDQVAQNENEIKKDDPVSEDTEKKVKYPGFDNKTGIYTVQNAQNLTEKSSDDEEISDKIVIPRGAKIYYNPSNTTLDGEKSLNISQGKNPNQYEIDGLSLPEVTTNTIPTIGNNAIPKTGNRVSLANKIYYNKINYVCSKPTYLYVDDTLAYLNANEKNKDFYHAYQSNNGSLEKILNDIFCKAGKLKTPEEIKNFDNTI